ncbi:hypothetical protein [Ethanoligenens harbinense]|uniref:Uncharacterized protein n=1 Tax=Ethanoligenens harbinense (strain DSM 18485 / JCM 12961 / CGMCC 1.5033 / YUAN-3) TaxID=663278 RepID=E6U4C0_ETHHY|nr:hypothetical protein [Ethanoligenens harbinense]ADU27727.1 hypothetical protein Ethha_2211 [Ethanoligenens harbinense YUAN-3]AVQ96757.1 hypothetical protein CXQ68_11385 [Ethanoligenens harbinense YUAN-3]AYF39419.1 hypothetical protein CXP51_11280 [Ethanoligenens harbinense]AYF42243.1 hypothetical protein CN246_11825 [Ethanoligenens harbinense]QCN92999.1 hypothetical protein DRA42_11420 [Ethanoligenens harbinense]
MFFTVLGWIAFALFILGLIVPKTIFISKKKTRKSSLLYLLIAIVCWIIAAIISVATAKPAAVSLSSSSSSASSVASVSKSSTGSVKPAPSSAPATPSTISVNQTLSDGYYTVGVDFPAGTYNFTAASGSGNVITTDGEINEIMGDQGDKTFNNAKLQNGTVLSVSGVQLQIASSNASGATLKPRNQSGLVTKQLAAGNYTAGTDFPAGTYDLTAVSGQGNVISQNGTLPLNAIMSTDDSDGMSTKTYKNVTFKAGNTLQITGVTISISPSK